ncbi:hypothetical protein [Georgenia sp. SUBG003]|uniref:hypothetical protein n=1 Tax=Georgenia sp. SUBG003 TaxID=1497974 RepID=UPI003AB1301D
MTATDSPARTVRSTPASAVVVEEAEPYVLVRAWATRSLVLGMPPGSRRWGAGVVGPWARGTGPPSDAGRGPFYAGGRGGRPPTG